MFVNFDNFCYLENNVWACLFTLTLCDSFIEKSFYFFAFIFKITWKSTRPFKKISY